MNTNKLSQPDQFLYNLFAREFCHPTAYYGNIIGRMNNHISEIFINFLNNKQNKEFYIKTIEDSTFSNLSVKFKKNAVNCINKCFNVFVFKETIGGNLNCNIKINIIAAQYYQYLEHKDLDLFKKNIIDSNIKDVSLINKAIEFIIEKHSQQSSNQQNSSLNQSSPNQTINSLTNQQNASPNQSLTNQQNSSSNQPLPNQIIDSLLVGFELNSDTVYQPLEINTLSNSSIQEIVPQPHDFLSNSTSTAQHFALEDVINSIQWQIEDRFANEEEIKYPENNERFANEEQIEYLENNERFANEEIFQSTTQLDSQEVNEKSSG